MATISLQHIQKIYPIGENSKKQKAFLKKAKEDNPETNKVNLKITEEGVVAVDDFNLEVEDNEFIVFVGPSGCGKSTTLRMIAGLEDITRGDLYIDGVRMNDIEPKDRDIAMVFQNYALYPHMTVLENICFPLEIKKVPKAERIEKAKKMAELVHVEGMLNRKPGQLSGGQQQRVAIARALVKEPRLLLLDEPLSNLDARLRIEMREEIRRIQLETGVTTIFVTHDQEEAMSISDRIILMKDGVFVQEGLSQDLYDNPQCRFAAEFLGNPPVNVFDRFDNLAENAVLAVRPEAFSLCRDGDAGADGFEAQIIRVSLLGKERIVYVQFTSGAQQGLQARTVLSSDFEASVGQKICLGLKKKGVFLFDKNTGVRL
jgi:ABC-type sugar transport system ATPase subunit